MPGFRGIRMVSFDKNQQQIIVRAPQGAAPIAYPVWPEPAVSILVEIMVHFYAPILNEKVQSQKEAYYQKAFDAFAFHLTRLEKENILPPDFLENLTKQEMFLKWQEIENKYNDLAISLVPGGPPGQHSWPYFDKMTFILKNERNRPRLYTTEQPIQPSSPQPIQPSSPQAIQPSSPQSIQPSSPQPTADNNIPPAAEPSPNATPSTVAKSGSVTENESEEQKTVTYIVEKSVSRVLDELRSDQKQSSLFKEKSKDEFQNKLLELMRRHVQLLEEQMVRQEEDRRERKVISERLATILDKITDKTVKHQ